MKIGKLDIHRPAALSLRTQMTFWRRVLRLMMFALITLFILAFSLGISGYFITQTEWFHKWTAEKLESTLRKELVAKIELSSLRLNIFSGLEADSVRIITQGDTVLSANKLLLKYELKPLLIHRIVVSGIVLENPRIKLLRSQSDSTWNVEHIAKPPADTTASKPFDWGIFLRNLTLNNATITVMDSLSKEPRTDRIHYTRTTLDNLNLQLGARLNIARNEFAITIDKCSFKERRTGFTANNLRLAVEADTSEISLTNLVLLTPNTDMRLQANISDVNVFSGKDDIIKKTLTASLEAEKLSSWDVNWFMPETFSLNSTFVISADITGSLNKLEIEARELQTGTSDLSGKVILDHLGDGRDFELTVDVNTPLTNYDDIKNAIPSVVLPELPFLHHVTLRESYIYLKRDSLHIKLDADVPAGSVKGVVDLRTSANLGYNANIDISNLNLAVITNSPSLGSSLNGHIVARGNGTTIEKANAQIDCALSNSSFAGRKLNSVILRGNTNEGAIKIDSLNIEFPSPEEAEENIYNDASYDELTRYIGVSGAIDLTDTKRPQYDVATSFQHMPLARLLGEQTVPSLLTGTCRVNGSGFHLDSLEGNIYAKFSEFLLSDRALFPFDLDLVLRRQTPQDRTLYVVSGPIDAMISGRYRLGTFGQVFLAQVAMIDRTIRNSLAVMKSDTAQKDFYPPFTLPKDTLDLKYNIKARNLSPISPFLAGVKLNAQGEVNGTLRGNPTCYEFAVDTARIPKFMMLYDSMYFYSQPMNLGMLLRTEDLNEKPAIMQADIRASCDSILRVDNTYFFNPDVWLRFLDGRAQFAVGTRINNRIPLRARGDIQLQENEYDLTLDTLRFGINRNLSFTTVSSARATITPRGTMIHSLLMKHDSSRATISAQGVVNSVRLDGMKLTLKNFNLRRVQAIPAVADIEAVRLLDGMIDSLTTIVSGKFTQPSFEVKGWLSNLRYNSVQIGRQSISGKYDGTILRAESEIISPRLPTASSNTISSVINDSIALKAIVSRFPLQLSLLPFSISLRANEKVGISLRANELSLGAVAPFIPGITNLKGTANAELSVAGTTPDNVDYTGLIRYSGASFLVPATNVRYNSRGWLSLRNDKFYFDSVDVFNEAGDLRGGHGRAQGYMQLRGFNVESIDARVFVPARERLLVMSEATAVVNTTMYGRTVISTEDKGELKSLRFHGLLTAPRLDGYTTIEEANIKFPPTSNTIVRTSTFVYKRTGKDYVLTEAVQPQKTEKRDTTFELPPEMRDDEEVSKGQVRRLGQSLTDILFVSVDARIKDKLDVKMDFQANEQLVASVKQEYQDEYLKFERDGNKSTKLLGNLLIYDATYKFYNNFKATGRISFTRGEIDNPDLNLLAFFDGERIINDRREEYRVQMNITGTKKVPFVKMTYYINGNEAPGMQNDPDKIRTNALLMTLFGRTREEMVSSGGAGGGGGLGGAIDQGVNSAKSAAVSAFLTNALQGGVIKNINIDFGGSGATDFSQARLQVTGQLFGANVTVGGSVADFTNNSSITLDLPLALMFNSDALRSFIAQFTRSANPGQNIIRQQKEWEIKVGYRYP